MVVFDEYGDEAFHLGKLAFFKDESVCIGGTIRLKMKAAWGSPVSCSAQANQLIARWMRTRKPRWNASSTSTGISLTPKQRST